MMKPLVIDYDSHTMMAKHVHGRHPKDIIVLHETVSGDATGLSDIINVEKDLANRDYGIHGMTDLEGNIAWARGLGNAVFWQCGGINERSMGIEQVSRVMLQGHTNAERRLIWSRRTKQLRATAMLVAAAARAWGIPLLYSDGDHPGVTSHWSVSQHHPESEGHTDCWPVHLGGYYPAQLVIKLARNYYKKGVHF